MISSSKSYFFYGTAFLWTIDIIIYHPFDKSLLSAARQTTARLQFTLSAIPCVDCSCCSLAPETLNHDYIGYCCKQTAARSLSNGVSNGLYQYTPCHSFDTRNKIINTPVPSKCFMKPMLDICLQVKGKSLVAWWNRLLQSIT